MTSSAQSLYQTTHHEVEMETQLGLLYSLKFKVIRAAVSQLVIIWTCLTNDMTRIRQKK